MDGPPLPHTPMTTEEFDQELVALAEVVRNLAIKIGEAEIAVHADGLLSGAEALIQARQLRNG